MTTFLLILKIMQKIIFRLFHLLWYNSHNSKKSKYSQYFNGVKFVISIEEKETLAEEIKIKVGSAWTIEEELTIEVRGRDSAGIEISFGLKDRSALENVLIKLKKEGFYNDFVKRRAPGELLDGSICLSGITSPITPPFLTFIYKKASGKIL